MSRQPRGLHCRRRSIRKRPGDRKAGRQRLEDSLQRARELAARYPQDARFHWACSEASEQLGDWFFNYSTDLDSVELHYHEYRDRMSKVIELVPNEPQYQMDYAAVFERLGNLHMRRKQYPEAAAAYEEFLRINIPFGEAAPDNAEIKFELSIAWVKVGQVSLASGDLDRARVAWSESVNRCRSLAQTAPTNARVYRQLNLSLKGMATVHRQSSEFEQERQCYEESMEFLNAFEKATGSSQFRSTVAMLKEQVDRSESAH
ncbi:MAG: hypothetical protein GY903_03275 [Fuerstiella sp.]|nr:hypothetical protein [Fuerstiella sp.]MCP4853497.1 hypothetical protein [Fuerstiella sp.]